MNIPTMAFMQHCSAVDKAADHIAELYYNQGYDIEDAKLFHSVCAKFGLGEDGFDYEREVIEAVKRRIR